MCEESEIVDVQACANLSGTAPLFMVLFSSYFFHIVARRRMTMKKQFTYSSEASVKVGRIPTYVISVVFIRRSFDPGMIGDHYLISSSKTTATLPHFPLAINAYASLTLPSVNRCVISDSGLRFHRTNRSTSSSIRQIFVTQEP